MLDFKKDNKKKQRRKGGRKSQISKATGGNRFWVNLLSTILILFILISVYSLIVENQRKADEIPLSELAQQIIAGQVESVVIRGDELEIIYIGGDEKRSKKEVDTALTGTLANYGVTQKQISTVQIEVKNPSGVRFWLLTFGPFLIPLLFIAFFIWFLSRQMRGAGMQAFTFGQSKARMISPSDKSQRITFKDVAGAEEAKEGLLEIVEFLKMAN